MSATRRILVAGLPAAAALALAGSPALATMDHPALGRPAATATPCAQTERDKCDYGATGAGTATPSGGHTRGHGGYATTPPATTPPATPSTTTPTSPAPHGTSPSAHVDTVPPTKATSPGTTILGASPTPTTSGGVSAGHALPVTGAPMGAIISLGVLMVAGGAASVWYSRRRRSV
jgi:LPXTG-motif cell wall-anchored protein